MGGGTWNGSNHGGLHTGADKNQNSGPYHNNGYTPSIKSYKEFTAGKQVIYIGMNKNKHFTKVPNGSIGNIVNKVKTDMKTSRTLIKVDFNEYGIRYVPKHLLQFTDDFKQHQIKQLNKDSSGEQNYRYENKKSMNEKLKSENYEKTLNNRHNNKEFRKFRKKLLDETRVKLEDELRDIKFNPIKNKYQKKEAELNQVLRTLTMNDNDQSLINEVKDDQSLINEVKDELRTIHNYKKDNQDKINKLSNLLENNNSKKYIREVYSKESYNNYLHCQMNNKNYKDFYEISKKPSREYIMDHSIECSDIPNINRLLYGLY
jgi:hypothetical protein